jgi:hypothetical protein
MMASAAMDQDRKTSKRKHTRKKGSKR